MQRNDETVDHLISSCSKIAQIYYKERHNKVASMLYWNVCKKYHLPVFEKWWEPNVDKLLQKKSNFSGTLKFKQKANIWLITYQLKQ